MAVLQKVKIGNEWVPVSGSNVNTGGGEASSSNTFIINSNKDFEVIEDSSLAGVISDPNTTYNDIKNAIDNNYNIALKEPRGNISYCLRADFVLEDQESGNKRIALFFTKSILTIRYDIILYIGLNNSILYMISKNDIFSKKEVEESIDNKATYVGGEAPTTDTVLWIDINDDDEPSQPSAGVWNGGVYLLPMGAAEALHNIDTYIFSDEEAQEFRRMMKNYSSTIIAIRHYDDRGTLFITPAMEVLFHSIDPIDIEVNVPSEARLVSYIDQNGFYNIYEDVEDGKIKVSC